MPDLPVMLRVAGRRCVIVGGGGVARRRAAALLDAGATVAVVAPSIEPALAVMPVELHRRPYQPGDASGAFLVVVATDDPAVNAAVAYDARSAGALVNRADEPGEGDVIVPAHAHHGPVTIAVHAGGVSPSAAAAIRRELSDALDPDWPRLLEALAPYRRHVQAACEDAQARRDRLRALASPEAMRVLKHDGLDALHAYCRRILDRTPDAGAAAADTGGDTAG